MMTKEERMALIQNWEKKMAEMTQEEMEIYDEIAEMLTTSCK